MPGSKIGSHCVIGVTGASGSGKTTFVRELAERIGRERVAVIQQDSYYIDRSREFKGDGSLNFDHPDALDWNLMAEHLRQLREGQAVDIPVYDFATHTRLERTVHVEPKPIILVDGILIFHPPQILELLDYKIYVDTPQPICFDRRLKRDVMERGRTPEGVRDQYRLTVKPMFDQFVEPTKKLADRVISGEVPFAPEIERVMLNVVENPLVQRM